jgi:hypothetical protein
MVNADNMPAGATEGLVPVVEDYQEQFKKVWVLEQ